jgi:predicted ATPase
MRLTRLYIRFFRSFNFDYERKADRRAEPQPWEMIGDAWFPFIRVDLDPAVTAVVGANESGKSHLIEAIKQGLTGEGIDRRDFCRYSALFSVETGKMRRPDFGVELEIQPDDVEALVDLPIDVRAADRVLLLRLGGEQTLLVDGSGSQHELGKKALASLEARLPVPLELETDVPLPDSIALDRLLGRRAGALSKRRRRFELVDLLVGLPEPTTEALTATAPRIAELLDGDGPTPEPSSAISPEQLAYTLLVEVARIDRSAFEDLEAALRDGQEGRVGGLIEEMNRSLARHLNFTRWWTQDREFQLRLSPRERELVFTIRDRTGTDYSFRERSRGLMYFLSYFVQLRAHRRVADRPEVLLMDEPDAFLSSVGQQDLLRALEHFARPDDGSREDQVVYVTHSPFLINKNAAHRIRVLDKGTDEEGTRVVRDVARNHYEPLRTSIGGFVAETAFVGGKNLIVEGVSDQVLLAGATSLLRLRGVPPRRLLDLNEVTIVPAGSASSVPYIAYLARGRDEVKPACVALLDGDEAGRDAARKLARSTDGRGKRILDDNYVVDIATWGAGADLDVVEGITPVEPEDLIPLQIATAAAHGYAEHLLGLDEQKVSELKPEAIKAQIAGAGGRLWTALELAFADAYDGAHIDKVGFAKEIVAFIDRTREQHPRPPGLKALEQNFGALVALLAERLARAEEEEIERRTNRRTDRIVRGFLRDFPEAASRDDADAVLRQIEASLEMSVGDDAVRAEIAALRREFKLSTDPLTPVPEFDAFRDRLANLKTKRRLAYRAPTAVVADEPRSGQARGKRRSTSDTEAAAT